MEYSDIAKKVRLLQQTKQPRHLHQKAKGTNMISKKFMDEYLKATKLSDADKKIKEAYNSAHRIREFEIQLYWTRTTYIWAMQAALIGISLLFRTSGNTTVVLDFPVLRISTAPSLSSLIAILLLSTLALIVAALWSLLLDGAKFWQNNWERHVDILGEKLNNNLYQVYPIMGGEAKPPYSVTKINSYIAKAFIVFWIINVIWSIWDITSLSVNSCGIAVFGVFILWCLLYASLVIIPCWQFKKTVFYSGLRMSNFGTEIYKEQVDNGNMILVQRNK